ncbi:MAG: hypothetical protein RIB32_03245 [Phycisphaerales bacterium]
MDAVLVITDGGPAALVAALMADDPASVHMWIGRDVSPDDAQVIERQARAIGAPPPQRESGDPTQRGPSARLLAAMHAARACGAGRVIWPIHHGADLDALLGTVERATLVTHLARLDVESADAATGVDDAPAPRVETPFADLTTRQIAELVVDLDAPLDDCRVSPEMADEIREIRRGWFQTTAATAAEVA